LARASIGHLALREHQSLAIALHGFETGAVILLIGFHGTQRLIDRHLDKARPVGPESRSISCAYVGK
jgi:hypothetical protein